MTIEQSAVTAANKRVATAVGRYAAAHRRKRGVSDPGIVDDYLGELAVATMARDLTTSLAKRPNLTVPQRLELIDLLLPSDVKAAKQIINQIRDHVATAELARTAWETP